MDFIMIFTAVGGAAWTAAYVFIARRGWLDGSYGMPAFALGLNMFSEFYWAFLAMPPDFLGGQSVALGQRVINIVWIAFNSLILVTLIRSMLRQRDPFVRFGTTGAYCGALVAAMLLLPSYQEVMNDRFPAIPGITLNLIMSSLFIALLVNRRSRVGLSVTGAYLKMIGSAGAGTSVLIAMRNVESIDSSAYSFMFTAICMYVLLDIVYIALLHWMPVSANASRLTVSKG